MENSAIVVKQEEVLQLPHFSNADGIAIGLNAVNIAREKNLKIAVDVSRGELTLFHACLDGAAVTNEMWMRRKKRVAYCFEKSSVQYELTENGEKALARSGLSPLESCAAGGAVPVRVAGTGMVGAVIVSGLKGVQDHQLAADAIARFLGKAPGEDYPVLAEY